ncbi:MAG: hypothetical protein H6807_14755 [Planctomycetes bacterium]|nr:hypothetical protein [Planctomycetota bacterium]
MTGIDWKRMVPALLLAGALLGAAAPAQKVQGKAAAGKEAKEGAKPKRIIGLDWYSSLDDAIAANRAGQKAGRPILYLRLLGDLEGFT